MSNTTTRDRHGREIIVGDVLKVYHFTAALRRKKHYMYKQVVGTQMLGGHGGATKTEYFNMSHLTLDADNGYHLGLREGVLLDYEIVQGYDFENRPRGEKDDL